MGAPVLTASTPIQCPHGVPAQAVPGQARVLAGGQPVLVQTDMATVAGCPFTLPGPTPSPCVTVRWVVGALRVRVNGVPVVTQASTTLSLAATQAPQGPAIVPAGMPRVLAT